MLNNSISNGCNEKGTGGGLRSDLMEPKEMVGLSRWQGTVRCSRDWIGRIGDENKEYDAGNETQTIYGWGRMETREITGMEDKGSSGEWRVCEGRGENMERRREDVKWTAI